MATTKARKFQAVANPEMHRAMVGFRTSNAAGSHDVRPNRQRTRSTSKRAAMRDWA